MEGGTYLDHNSIIFDMRLGREGGDRCSAVLGRGQDHIIGIFTVVYQGNKPVATPSDGIS